MAGPEARRTIGRAGREDVAQGMPIKRPDDAIVSALQGPHGILLVVQVKVDGALGTGRGEERFMDRMPCNSIDLLFVGTVRLDLSERANVKELYNLILAGGQEPVSVAIPLYIQNCILVAVDGGHVVAALGIPELDEVVLAARGEERLKGMPMDALYVPAMSRQHALLKHLGKVPDLDGAVVRAAGKLAVVWRERDLPDGLLVSGEDLQVVHGGLPDLDKAAMVSRGQEVAVVGPAHGADGRVVGLQDRLKVKGHPIPQGELSRRGARQQSSSIRRPLRTSCISSRKGVLALPGPH